MGSFDQGLAGMASLRSVNEWIGVINSNLGGTNRTAYKQTRVSFGGGISNVLRDPRAEVSGIQIPESTLTIENTRIDFTQGTVIQDGELTHLAINGDGFFGVNDGVTTFYTRDGDFKWTVFGGSTILTTSGGLTVMGNFALTSNITRIGTGATFNVSISTVSGASSCVAVFAFGSNQALKFSKFGSTVFDNAIANTVTRATTVELIQSALESSNAALNDTLPELSLHKNCSLLYPRLLTYIKLTLILQ